MIEFREVDRIIIYKDGRIMVREAIIFNGKRLFKDSLLDPGESTKVESITALTEKYKDLINTIWDKDTIDNWNNNKSNSIIDIVAIPRESNVSKLV